MKIELLQGSLTVAENPGLESTDPRFDDIVTLVQEGNFELAAARCEAILAEGVYDIRLICYFLYGYWQEQGLASLPAVNQCLAHLLQENWEAIGPLGNREKYLEKSLDWLFRQLLKKIKYEEGKNSLLWQQWQASVSAEDAEEMLESGKSLRAGVISRLEDKAGIIIDQWSKIDQWLRIFQKLQYRQPEPAASQPQQQQELAAMAEAMPGPAAAVAPARVEPAKNGVMEIEISYHLQLLLKKLAGFERLLEQQSFPQAALLADDINQTLQAFDPKLYFPKIFETFVRMQAIHLEELLGYMDQRGSPEWEAMQEWLKVDADGFIDYAASGD